MQNTIERDQSIAAAILKLANSAYYGYARQISDIKQAVIVIGFNTAVSVAISISVLKALTERFESAEFNLSEFWKHTIFTGEAARMIARETDFPLVSQAYIIGLLHDLGKIVQFYLNAQDFEDALFESRTLKKPLNDCESKIFGFDHQDAGAWLGDKWKLPQAIVAGMKHHHDVETCPKKFWKEVYIANAANYIVNKGKFGMSGNGGSAILHKKADESMKIDPKTFDHITAALELKRKEVDAFLDTII